MAVHGGAVIFVPQGVVCTMGTDYAQKRRTPPQNLLILFVMWI